MVTAYDVIAPNNVANSAPAELTINVNPVRKFNITDTCGRGCKKQFPGVPGDSRQRRSYFQTLMRSQGVSSRKTKQNYLT